VWGWGGGGGVVVGGVGVLFFVWFYEKTYCGEGIEGNGDVLVRTECYNTSQAPENLEEL